VTALIAISLKNFEKLNGKINVSGYVVVSITATKYPKEIILREGIFILALRFRGFMPW
jgi:hypothetical protein